MKLEIELTAKQVTLLGHLLRIQVMEQTQYDVESGFKPISTTPRMAINPFAGFTKTDLAEAQGLIRKIKKAQREQKA